MAFTIGALRFYLVQMYFDVAWNTWLIVALIIVAPSMDGAAYHMNIVIVRRALISEEQVRIWYVFILEKGFLIIIIASYGSVSQLIL